MRTGDIARQFGVSITTIQNWITEFGEYLSESARKIGIKQRLFTQDDFLVLATVASLSVQGFDYEQIKQRLAEGYRIDDPTAATIGYTDGRVVPAAAVEQMIDASAIRMELELVKQERDKLLELLETARDQNNEREEFLRVELKEAQQKILELTELAATRVNPEEVKQLREDVSNLREKLARAETEAQMLREQHKRRGWFSG